MSRRLSRGHLVRVPSVLVVLGVLLAPGTGPVPAVGQVPSSRSGLIASSPDSWFRASHDSVVATRSTPLLESTDLAYAGVFVGALGLALAADGWDTRISQSSYHGGDGPDAAFGSVGAVLGNGWYDLGTAAGVYAIADLVGAEGTARAALRSVEALALADVMATLLKAGIGRGRPTVEGDATVFEPPTLDSEYFSFPSGHTAHAFALAGTLSRALEAEWVPFVAYPLAAGVGASRVIHGRHWPTDVVAGASVGLFAAELPFRFHGERPGADEESYSGPRPVVTVLPSGGTFVGVSLPLH